jgi:hypothetical protein
MDGRTEIGLLTESDVNGVVSWWWASAEDLTPAARKRRTEAAVEETERGAENEPDKVTGCAIEGPESVFTTRAVCAALIRFVSDNGNKLRPYAGYAILQACGHLSSSSCLAIIKELQSLASTPQTRGALTERCVDDLGMLFPGSEKPQYMNSCEELMNYFR